MDISETGLQISGIPTRFGDTKEFLVQADYFADVLPFVIEARCQWASKPESGRLFSGFEITSISKQAFEELKKLTRALTPGG